MLGDSDGVDNTLGVAISGNFEGYRSEGSVVVGAIFVAGIFAKHQPQILSKSPHAITPPSYPHTPLSSI